MKQTKLKRIWTAFLAAVMLLGTLSPMANVAASQEARDYLTISDFKADGEIAATSAGVASYTTDKSLVGTSFKTKITYEDLVGSNTGWWNALYYGASSKEMKYCVSVFALPNGSVMAYINGSEEGSIGAKAIATVPAKGAGKLELLLEIDISVAVEGKSTITIKVDGNEVLKKEDVNTSLYSNKIIVENDSARISAVYRDYVVQNQESTRDYLTISDFKADGEIAATSAGTTSYTTDKSLVGTSFKTKITYEDVVGSNTGWWNALYYGASSKEMKYCVSVFALPNGSVMAYINGSEEGSIGAKAIATVPAKGAGKLELLLEIDISVAVEGKSTITIKVDGNEVLKKEDVNTSLYSNKIIVENDSARISAVYRDYAVQNQEITTVTVNKVIDQIEGVKHTQWVEGLGWRMYLGINESLANIGTWKAMNGMTYSVNGGAAQAFEIQTGEAGQLYFVLNLPQNVANTTLTLQGQATRPDGSVGIKFAQPLTLYGSSAGWSLSATKYIQSTVKEINSATKYNGDKWFVYLNMNGDFTDMPYYKTLTGFEYSINGGEKKPLTGCNWQDHDGGTLFFTLSDLPQNVTENTKLTISGAAKTSDETIGLELTTDITIYINDAGWSLTGYLDTIDYIQASAKSVNYATGYIGDRWFVYLDMNGNFSDMPYYKALTGFEYSINGGEKKALTGCDWQEHDGGTLFFKIADLPKNVTENTKITITGKAKTNDGHGIQLTKEITLYVNDAGWSLTGFMKPIKYVQASAKSVDDATKYIGNKWYIYLNMHGNFANVPYYQTLSGFEYSIDGGEKKPLTGCDWQEHNGGTLFFTLSELPKNISKNTKITITGKAKTNSGAGVELIKEITLYTNEGGWSLTGYPKPVNYIKASAESINYATKYIGDRWYIYLDMKGSFSKMPFEKNLAGFEYSINGGKKQDLMTCDWQKHDGGTLFFTLKELPEKITKNTKITITGKAKTNAGVGIQLTKKIEIYANKYGLELGKYKKAPVYTDITVDSINYATSFLNDKWYVYLNTDKELPGEVDHYFEGMVLEVNGKKHNITVQHAFHEGTLFFNIEKEWLSNTASNGARVTLKAGKGLQQAAGIGINLKKDVTLYKFFDTLTLNRPTTKTEYTDVTFSGLTGAVAFSEAAKTWYMELAPHQLLPGDTGTNFYYITAYLNGKKLTLKGMKDANNIIIGIPESVLPGNTKKATLTIKAGMKAVGGYGNIGIHVKEEFSAYLFNGLWSDEKFDKMKETELFCTRLFNAIDQPAMAHLYFYVNSEFPGKAWYNNFTIPVKVDGKTVNVRMNKADSAAGKILYLALPKTDLKIKEGTLVTVKGGTEAVSGGYKIKITKDFQIVYTNGMWLENRKSDVKAPAAQNLWDVARFKEGYIPSSNDGTVLMSGEHEYNQIISTERMKDFTVSFSGKKIYDDATSPSFSLILRGTPISEDDPISQTVLNGYVITFEGYEYTEEANPTRPDLWGVRTCHINIWKNGANNTLRDQYCIGTFHNLNDNPYFKYDETYDYEVSVYNISETVACIEFKVNGELVYKCYDEAGMDPADPAINAGIFAIYGTAPTYYGGKTVELESIIAEKTECKVGEEVAVAVTYPSVLEGAEFTVDKEGGRVENGKFGATKAGTYTISATYKGKALKPITITVKERVVAADDEAQENQGMSPILMIALIVAGVVVVVGGVVTAIVLRNKKKKQQNSEE